MNSIFTSENYKAYFSWEKFKDLSSSSREELIRFAVKEIAQEKGLKPVNVRFYKGEETSRGGCSQVFCGRKCIGHELRLNNDTLYEKTRDSASYSVFNTINHELEHASQYERSENRSIKHSNPEVLEQRLNDQHYYSYSGAACHGSAQSRFDSETNELLYFAQSCEAEARAAGYSAVEGLRQEGKVDPYLESYLKQEKADEYMLNKEIVGKLGMHSREQMAREELGYLSMKKVDEKARQSVLEYARQKDYEMVREILKRESRDILTDDQIQDKFNKNEGYPDFFQSEYYKTNKVTKDEHKQFAYARYKLDEAGEVNTETIDEVIDFTSSSVPQELIDKNTLEIDLSEDRYAGLLQHTKEVDQDFFERMDARTEAPSAVQEDRAFFERMDARTEAPSAVQEDRAFFERMDAQTEAPSAAQEDKAFFERMDAQTAEQKGAEADPSFFERMEQKADEFGKKLDSAAEQAMQTAAKVTQGTTGPKQ